MNWFTPDPQTFCTGVYGRPYSEALVYFGEYNPVQEETLASSIFTSDSDDSQSSFDRFEKALSFVSHFEA